MFSLRPAILTLFKTVKMARKPVFVRCKLQNTFSLGRGHPLPIAEMPKFKKVCSNPLHSEWKTEAVKDLTKFGGLQPFIKAFQSLAAELGGKCSTIFCVNCLKTCRQKKFLHNIWPWMKTQEFLPIRYILSLSKT